MTIPIVLVGICVIAVIALNNLRPLTLQKLPISSRAETWLTLLICIVFMVSIFFLFYFLVFGLISWIPAGTADIAWLSVTVLLLIFGILGVLLLRDKRKGNLSMVCFLAGYLSLFFLIMGNYIVVD